MRSRVEFAVFMAKNSPTCEKKHPLQRDNLNRAHDSKILWIVNFWWIYKIRYPLRNYMPAMHHISSYFFFTVLQWQSYFFWGNSIVMCQNKCRSGKTVTGFSHTIQSIWLGFFLSVLLLSQCVCARMIFDRKKTLCCIRMHWTQLTRMLRKMNIFL